MQMNLWGKCIFFYYALDLDDNIPKLILYIGQRINLMINELSVLKSKYNYKIKPF